MSSQGVECVQHGKQGIGVVCIHIAKAIKTSTQVGFFWSPDPELTRPFAWCAACEQYLNENDGDVEKLATIAEFVIICAKCWDEAKAILYDQHHPGQ